MQRRFALITGGTKGIGKAVAESFLDDGFDLLLSYATDDVRAVLVQRELQSAHPGSQVDIVRADASDLSVIEVIVSAVFEKNRPLDVVVLNAGVTDRSSFEDLDPVSWQNVFTTNVHFPTFLIQALLERLEGGSSIIFTGSAMGVYAHSMSLAYGVSKASVHALVKNLVKFLAPFGVRINAVAPGFVDTEWQKNKPQELRDSIQAKVALGRFCEPQELADVYVLLANNKYLNGEVIAVDGGYSFQ